MAGQALVRGGRRREVRVECGGKAQHGRLGEVEGGEAGTGEARLSMAG